MGDKDKNDQTDTDVSSDEVMDEMDDLEATAEMLGLEGLPQDNDATVVLKTPRHRKTKGGDNS